MSDPTTKGEIEDVLSSIRKLVTDGDMPQDEGKSGDGKLVLTSDFRIDRPGKNDKPEAKSGSAAKSGTAAAKPDDLASTPPDGDDLEREVAELEAALMGSEASGKPGNYDAWEPAGEGKAPMAKVAGDVSDAEMADVEAAGEETGNAATGGETAKPAEAVILATSKQTATSADASSDAHENVGRPDVESLLDENDLRALVAEVLREELKGPLGERITRNVRKLVRREIAQALSSLDIE